MTTTAIVAEEWQDLPLEVRDAYIMPFVGPRWRFVGVWNGGSVYVDLIWEDTLDIVEDNNWLTRRAGYVHETDGVS